MGVSRTVEVDTTGGPGFGFEQYKQYDFLVLKEVVLTFDDGPWPGNTRAVLDALAEQCLKATFFPIGKHALWHPEILKEVAAAGHTIGSHTWSHANLAKMSLTAAKRHNASGADLERLKHDTTIEEIEKGFSAVKLALGTAPQPFFRVPEPAGPQGCARLSRHAQRRHLLARPRQLRFQDAQARGRREIGDAKLERKGKGIILMHDFQQATAKAVPALFAELKAKGYKVVHMRAKAPYTTLAEWDDAAKSEVKGAIGGDRPISSVIRTIEEAPPQPVAVGAGAPAVMKK